MRLSIRFRTASIISLVSLPVLLSSCLGAVTDSLQGDSYMEARIDGQAWKAGNGTYYLNYGGYAADSLSLFSGVHVVGSTGLEELLTLKVAKAKEGVYALQRLNLVNFVSYERAGGEAYLVRSGTISITRVSGDRIEGEFECELYQDADGPNPGKTLRITEGRFAADNADFNFPSL